MWDLFQNDKIADMRVICEKSVTFNKIIEEKNWVVHKSQGTEAVLICKIQDSRWISAMYSTVEKLFCTRRSFLEK